MEASVMFTGMINDYLNGLIFYNTHETIVVNGVSYVTYLAVIKGELLNATRLVALVVPEYMAYSEKATAEDLVWVSVQTRTTTDRKNFPPQTWKTPSDSYRFEIVDRSNGVSRYRFSEMDIPYEIYLKHNPKKKNEAQWPNTLSLDGIFQSFQAVCNFIPSKITLDNVYDSLDVFSE